MALQFRRQLPTVKDAELNKTFWLTNLKGKRTTKFLCHKDSNGFHTYTCITKMPFISKEDNNYELNEKVALASSLTITSIEQATSADKMFL